MTGGRPEADRIARALAELLDARPEAVRFRPSEAARGAPVLAHIGRSAFRIAWRSSGDVAHVTSALAQLRDDGPRPPTTATPIVAVPFMGPAGAGLCERAKIGWLDLSGNARIVAPGVRIRVEGRPNRSKRAGRPSSLFAPKSARITRWLLIHADEALTQRELSRATGVDEGLTSRVVRRLEQEELVARDDRGSVRVAKADALLDAFREAYDFEKHAILKGHVAARSGEELLRRVTETFAHRDAGYAATGLAAAWLWSPFADFRLVTIFLRAPAAPALLEEIGFREETRGANLWLVAPNDDGVFHGASERSGVPCAHPVQVYLDLKAQPERSAEAATQLRGELLRWSTHA